MQMDKALIKKFLESSCNATEAEQVHQYLTRHPEALQQYYQREWEETDGTGSLPPHHAANMYLQVSRHMQKNHVIELRRVSWIAAAAVAVVACCIWLFQPPVTPTVTAANAAPTHKTVMQESPAPKWMQQQNHTVSHKKFTLPDGSIATLSPKAGIKYLTALEPGKRDIYLDGEAFFEVVKDKTRPFTVYAGNLSTTALGTSFRVTATPSSVKVKLMTGKVVIRSVKRQLAGWEKEVYLLPGQQMKYDAIAQLVKVSRSDTSKPAIAAPAYDHGEEMAFDNTPLQQVFDKLKQVHHTNISYTPEELNGLTFSGTIFHNDPLPVILQAIGRMNDLSVTTSTDGFSMQKAH